jgi:hypothetical protein
MIGYRRDATSRWCAPAPDASPGESKELIAVLISTDDADLEDRTVELRQEGRSWVAIADLLGYERGAYEAFRAFKRALRRRPADEQRSLRQEELARLISMEDGFRADPRLSPEELNRCLSAISALRATLKIA